jgi:hypothetical protein
MIRTRKNESSSNLPASDSIDPESRSQRCSVKGCIFPAASTGGRLCLIHRLTEKDPNHFLSVQPSSFCLDRANFGVPESPRQEERTRERKRFLFYFRQLRMQVA